MGRTLREAVTCEPTSCDRCGSAYTLIPDEDDDMCCWQCGYTRIRVPRYIMDIFEQRIGQDSLLCEPHYREISL